LLICVSGTSLSLAITSPFLDQRDALCPRLGSAVQWMDRARPNFDAGQDCERNRSNAGAPHRKQGAPAEPVCAWTRRRCVAAGTSSFRSGLWSIASRCSANCARGLGNRQENGGGVLSHDTVPTRRASMGGIAGHAPHADDSRPVQWKVKRVSPASQITWRIRTR
jgi:hypothetical protein